MRMLRRCAWGYRRLRTAASWEVAMRFLEAVDGDVAGGRASGVGGGRVWRGAVVAALLAAVSVAADPATTASAGEQGAWFSDPVVVSGQN
ncbi:MAG: hypothetical protein M3O70_27720, partial [Actinomycetota bacterium]|nr:hypothetical protein [Actinomycetota bacterium]